MLPLQEWQLSPSKAQALALSKSGTYRKLRAWALSKSGNYRELQALALSKSGNCRKLRALALSKSGNYREMRALALSKRGSDQVVCRPKEKTTKRLESGALCKNKHQKGVRVVHF